ncbi:MAG: Hpt domain-containing protein [Kiritimatiellae bacterium]|nr:Hpt domain-containing protein [Kiritimatiellia bacterium]
MKESCRAYLLDQLQDGAVVEEVYREYAETARGKVAEMKSLFAGCEWGDLDRAAHALKGAALTAGDNETAEAAVALRGALAQCDAGGVSGRLGALERLVDGL